MNCSACGFENPEGMKFCGQCAEPLRVSAVCAECPSPEQIESRAQQYLEYVLGKWDGPLADVTEQRLSEPIFMWGEREIGCVEAMMEHAVVHPARHQFQPIELMGD